MCTDTHLHIHIKVLTHGKLPMHEYLHTNVHTICKPHCTHSHMMHLYAHTCHPWNSQPQVRAGRRKTWWLLKELGSVGWVAEGEVNKQCRNCKKPSKSHTTLLPGRGEWGLRLCVNVCVSLYASLCANLWMFTSVSVFVGCWGWQSTDRDECDVLWRIWNWSHAHCDTGLLLSPGGAGAPLWSLIPSGCWRSCQFWPYSLSMWPGGCVSLKFEWAVCVCVCLCWVCVHVCA